MWLSRLCRDGNARSRQAGRERQIHQKSADPGNFDAPTEI
jgi:hypothetical protein